VTLPLTSTSTHCPIARHLFMPSIHIVVVFIRSSYLLTPPPPCGLDIFCFSDSAQAPERKACPSPRQTFGPMMLVRQARCLCQQLFCVPPLVHSLRISLQLYPCLGHLASSVSRSPVKRGRPGSYCLYAVHSMANGTSLIGFGH
jgi:hypothetical protein